MRRIRRAEVAFHAVTRLSIKPAFCGTRKSVLRATNCRQLKASVRKADIADKWPYSRYDKDLDRVLTKLMNTLNG
jgi:hypothetical protein